MPPQQKMTAKSKFTKKKSHTAKDENFTNLFAQNNNEPASLNQSNFCTADQCSLGGHQSTPSTSMPAPTVQAHQPAVSTTPVFNQQQSRLRPLNSNFNNSTQECTMPNQKQDSNYDILDKLSPELFQMIQDAAKKGILSSFLLTISGEWINDYLSARHYPSAQIYIITQVVRSLTLISLGSSLSITLSLPLINYCLTTYAKINPETASSLTRGTMLTFQALTGPAGLINTSLTLAVGLGSGLITNKVSKFAYNLIQHSIFSSQKGENCSDELTKASDRHNTRPSHF